MHNEPDSIQEPLESSNLFHVVDLHGLMALPAGFEYGYEVLFTGSFEECEEFMLKREE